MIKANELRIGNWLLSTSHKQFFRVQLIDKDREIINAEPIPLTEEWLLKLPENEWNFIGFGNRQIWQHVKFRAIQFEYAHGQVFVYFNDEMISVKDYLHQLQNMFFCLCGTELELKEGK